LSANDLGWTGSHQVGICIPKSVVRLGFFPELDTESFNPNCLIAARLEPSGQSAVLKYIYYNGRLTGRTTRDEYRLSRTTKLFRILTARPGDLLRLRWLDSGEMEISALREGDEDDDGGDGSASRSGDDNSGPLGSGSVFSTSIGSKGEWTVTRVVVSKL
jgi:hypothetical protein